MVEEAFETGSQLARDWALFQTIESGAATIAWRCWRPLRPVVVLGRNGRPEIDILEEACRDSGTEVLRRFTGGGTVVLSQGCLVYTLAVSLEAKPELRDVAASFRHILERLVVSLAVSDLSIVETDLVLGDRKVSGNSQRRGRRALLQHGTLLHDFDAELATRLLREPLRQPRYRRRREHASFLGNLPLAVERIEQRLAGCFRLLAAEFESTPLSTSVASPTSGTTRPG